MEDLRKRLVKAAEDGDVQKVESTIAEARQKLPDKEPVTVVSRAIRFLVKSGIDVHMQDDKALRWAAKAGDLELLQYLLDVGADVHAEDEEALRDAAKEGHVEVVRCLIAHGADVHIMNEEPLSLAASWGNLEVVKYLIEEAGADPLARWGDAEHLAEYWGHRDVEAYLEEQMARARSIFSQQTEEV